MRKAFTLLELIISIAIVSVLSSVSVGNYMSYKKESVAEQTEIFLKRTQLAVNNYYSRHDSYPCDIQPDSATPSPVNFSVLINEKFLTEEPKLSDGSIFGVNYNGKVVIMKYSGGKWSINDDGNITTDNSKMIVLLNNGESSTNNTEVTLSVKMLNEQTGYKYSITDLSPGTNIDTSYFTPLTGIAYSKGSANTHEVKLTSTPGMKSMHVTLYDGSNNVVDSKDVSIQLLAEDSNDTTPPDFGASPVFSINYDSSLRGIVITWNAASDVNGVGVQDYRIERSQDNFADYNEDADTVGTTTKNTFTDIWNLQSSQVYYYRIVAIDGAKNETNKNTYNNYTAGGDSLVMKITTPTVENNPATINNLTGDNNACTGGTELVNVQITELDGIDSAYISYMQNNSGTWETSSLNLSDKANSIYSTVLPVNRYTFYKIYVVSKRGITYSDCNGSVGYYTLSLPLVDAYDAEFSNDSFIDKANSNCHYYNGSVTLP